jgi:hypothetical protein
MLLSVVVVKLKIGSICCTWARVLSFRVSRYMHFTCCLLLLYIPVYLRQIIRCRTYVESRHSKYSPPHMNKVPTLMGGWVSNLSIST